MTVVHWSTNVMFHLCPEMYPFLHSEITILIESQTQDCNFGMQKRTHFRTEMEHNICRPVNNSHVSHGYQFCKNITFILYIIMQGIINQFTLFSINISSIQIEIIFF